MPRIKNIFAEGKMDKESSPAYVQQGFHRHAENLIFRGNSGDDGEAKNIKGSELLSDATGGNTDFKCICAYFNNDKDCIYYYLATSARMLSKVIEYDIINETTTQLLNDTNGVLRFAKNGYITGVNEINGLLYWSEWENNPRMINIERAKTYGTNGFTEDDIKVIKRPPVQKLRTTLQNTVFNSQQENFIEDIMIHFSYRWRYLDGEYSALAPFTNPQFYPRTFNYDYSEQSNKSMVNRYNQVLLEFDTGDHRVAEIQLVWKESGSKNAWIIDDFDKAKLGYADNAIESFAFDNSKTKQALPQEVLKHYYDNVPRWSKSQFIINRRLFYGNNLENYNLLDENNAPIEIDYELELVSTDNTELSGGETVPTFVPKNTAKSNRDYEVGMVYIDEDGRMTTVLNSKLNTLYIEASKSIAENKIKVVLAHKPPYWAKYFRFFIRQNKKGYDQLLPVVFYRDGVYAWLKIEGNDADKLKIGEFLIVKSDTSGPLSTLVKTRILEIVEQDENFLESEVPDPYEVRQRKGTYVKVKTSNFSLNPNAVQIYDSTGGGFRSSATSNNIGNNQTYVEDPIYYNFNGLNDVNITGTYSNADDIRYEIEVFTQGTPDTFRWREFNVVTDTVGVWNDNGGLGINITGSAQALSNGLSVTFGATTGHDIDDRWVVSAKSLTRAASWNENSSAPPGSFGRRAIVMYMGKPISTGEGIRGGAQITIRYDDDGSDAGADGQLPAFEDNFTSTQDYANIEEWFYGDNIISQLTYPNTLDRVMFRRGTFTKVVDGQPQITSIDPTKNMVMLFMSSAHYSGGESIRVVASINITELDNSIILETEPTRQQEDLYFEIGKTYKTVQSGGKATYHSAVTNDFGTELPNTAGDVSQDGSNDLEVTLDWFNAFCYGNGIESYKVLDALTGKGTDVGQRSLTNLLDEYKETHRTTGISWSDVYDDETGFNGLSTFNLSLINFIDLDKENGSIQKMHVLNGDLLVLQEDAVGILPVNKNIITDAQGNDVVGISTNVLDQRSYRPYASGRFGISKNPETFVQSGSRNYFTDQQRGVLIRLANDGITTIDQYYLRRYFSDQMLAHKNSVMIAGFDTTRDEYLLYLPLLNQTLAFKEDINGFPNFYTWQPDFILNANNVLYVWRQGKMYRMYTNEVHNNFFGVQYESRLKFYFNQEFSTEKVWKALSLEGSHPWKAIIKTGLTGRTIEKTDFVQKEDYWYVEIMGNTNDDIKASKILGLGEFAITGGEILTTRRPPSMSIGDSIISSTLSFAANVITDITADRIILQDNITVASSFLMYKKNQTVDGNSIRGDILEVELINDDTEEVTLRCANAEFTKSFYS